MSDAIKNLVPIWIVYVDGKRLDVQYEGMLEKIVINDKLNGVGIVCPVHAIESN